GFADNFAKYPASAATFLPGGQPAAGARFKNPALAESMRTVAREGRASFYGGGLGERIVGALRELGGLFTMEDWCGHPAELYKPPIATTYRDAASLTRPYSAGGAEHRRARRSGGARPLQRRSDSPDGRGQEAGLRRPPGALGRPEVRRDPDRDVH